MHRLIPIEPVELTVMAVGVVVATLHSQGESDQF